MYTYYLLWKNRCFELYKGKLSRLKIGFNTYVSARQDVVKTISCTTKSQPVFVLILLLLVTMHIFSCDTLAI